MSASKGGKTIIKGSRLILKGIDKVTDEYERWLNDPEITQYMEVARNKVLTRTELEHWLDKTNNDPDIRYWGIYLKWEMFDSVHSLKCSKIYPPVENKLIGTIKLHINWIHRHADIGIMIGDKTEWGKGYASEAIGIVKGYAFNALGLYKLWAGIHENNIASLKSFEKNGFTEKRVMLICRNEK